MKLFLKIIIFLLCFICFAQKDSLLPPKIGLVLSGGGAKGFAHIGAIQALEEFDLCPSFVGGTSMGAIIGGLYASGYSANDLEEIVKGIDFNKLLLNAKNREDIPFFDKTYKEKYIFELPFNDFKLQIPNAVSKGQGPANIFSYLLKDVQEINDFDKLPIPFLCIGTNLETGESEVFRSGNLVKSILASSAYPTLLNPVEVDGKLYTDGGITNNFPAKEVKEMGADLLIGIELGQGLLTSDNINSAPKILEQIIRFNIVNKTEEQKEFIDLYVHPDLLQYSVISFKDRDSIIQKGYNATKKVLLNYPDLKKLQTTSCKQKSYKNLLQHDSLYITHLKINGLKKFKHSYIEGKMNLDLPSNFSYKNFTKGIDILYSTGNFETIFYKIKSNETGKSLILDIKENPTNLSTNFSLRYDDLYKTNFLFNITAKHLILKNSSLSLDVILGDFFRYNVNYFVDNGVYPSFGFSAMRNQFNANLNSINNINLNEIEYNWEEYKHRFYAQSTYAEKYAFGFGLENQIIKINTNNLSDSNPNQTLSNSSFNNLYFFLAADNRDNPNFPSKGIKLDSEFKFITSSNSGDFSNGSFLDIILNWNISLNPRTSLQNRIEFGTFLNDDTPFSQQFILGGFNQQKFLNTSTFYGIPYGANSNDQKFIFSFGLQNKLSKNHYIIPRVSLANLESNLRDVQFLSSDTYLAYGIHYGYDSPFGPLNFYWFYSPQNRKGLFNISLGFWF